MQTTQQMIEVMQAHVAGKLIQFRAKTTEEHSFTFINVANPSWNWLECEYRVAPDMEEFAAEIYSNAHKNGCDVKECWRAVIEAVKRGDIV